MMTSKSPPDDSISFTWASGYSLLISAAKLEARGS